MYLKEFHLKTVCEISASAAT